MPTFSREYFTGGTADGRGIAVVATATAGTLIHTVPASVKDSIYLEVGNIHTSAVDLTIEFGGVTITSDLIQQRIAASPSGLVVVIGGLTLAPGLVIRAFASVASKIEVFGYIVRST